MPQGEEAALITRYIQLHALKAGVDPDLAVAVAMQESRLNPNAVGDNGNSLGLFQLQRAAAIDAGIDPNQRGDFRQNVRGGIRYLKQQLDKEGGNVERALSRYNRGTPTYRGIGDPRYVEHVMQYYPQGQTSHPSRLLSRLRRAVSPASAEAAEPTVQDSAQSPRDRNALEARRRQLLEERRRLLLEERERLTGQPAGTASGVPQASPAPVPVQAVPAPPPGAPAPQAQPQPQSLLSRIGQAAETAVHGVPIAGQLYPLVKPVVQAQYGEQLEQFPRAGAAGIVSATGAMLGTAAGSAVAPFTGPLAPAMPLVGEMAGSYLGRQLNVGLGLEDPGTLGDVASVSVPPAVRGATRVLSPLVTRATKAVVRHLPGAETAMHAEIGERLTRVGESIRPPRPVADYYAEAARYNPAIAPNRLHTTASEILRQEMRLRPSARNPELVRIAEDMRDLSAQGLVPLDDLYAHQQRIGEIVQSWRNRGDTGARDIRRLYAAFHDDLTRAANRGVPGAEALRTAIRASRREHAAEDFQELFRPGAGGITVDPQGRVQFHGGRLHTRWQNRLQDDATFRASLDPQEIAEVEEIITQAQRLERLRPPRGAQYGSGRSLTRAVVGSVAGGPVGTAIAVAGPDVIAAAMQTQRGRAAVRWALQQGGGRINADDLAVIAAIVRPAAQEAAQPSVSAMGGGPVGP